MTISIPLALHRSPVFLNPVFTEPICSESFDMLLYQGFSNLNVQDESGLAVLHRAAAYESAKDVQYLVRNGADTILKTSRYLWTPIFSAVCYDNVEAFRELLALEETDLQADYQPNRPLMVGHYSTFLQAMEASRLFPCSVKMEQTSIISAYLSITTRYSLK